MKLILVPLVAALFVLASCGSTTSSGGGGGSSSSETTPSYSSSSAQTSATTAQQTTPNNAAQGTTVVLSPINGSTTSGSATLTDVPGGGVKVELSVEGLPDPNVTYLAHIHPGTCAGEQGSGEEQHQGSAHEDQHSGHEGTIEEIEYPLSPISADSQGRGSTTSTLDGVTVRGLFSGGPKYINVHAEGSGNPPAIACGQLNY